jgi:UDP-glucose 4-epimerase
MTAVYPGVQVREGTGEFATLLSNEKARRLLGYVPAHSWREFVG